MLRQSVPKYGSKPSTVCGLLYKAVVGSNTKNMKPTCKSVNHCQTNYSNLEKLFLQNIKYRNCHNQI